MSKGFMLQVYYGPNESRSMPLYADDWDHAFQRALLQTGDDGLKALDGATAIRILGPRFVAPGEADDARVNECAAIAETFDRILCAVVAGPLAQRALDIVDADGTVGIATSHEHRIAEEALHFAAHLFVERNTQLAALVASEYEERRKRANA